MQHAPPRRFDRRSARTSSGAGKPAAVGPRMYLELSDSGVAAAEDQRSLPRKLFVVLSALICMLAMPLYWATSAQGANGDGLHPVVVKSSDDDDERDDDDDNRGPGGGDDTDRDNTGQNTRGNTDLQSTAGPSTRGESDPGDNTGATEQRTAADTDRDNTGQNTRGNTDRQNTAGASTRGETDPGDNTGATERR